MVREQVDFEQGPSHEPFFVIVLLLLIVIPLRLPRFIVRAQVGFGQCTLPPPFRFYWLPLGFFLGMLLAVAPAVRATSPNPSSPDSTSPPAEVVPDEAEPESHARLTVTGLGWIENLSLKNVLRQVRADRQRPASFDANFIEDGGFLLLNHIRRLGFLRAQLVARTTAPDGTVEKWSWTEDSLPDLPRTLAATRLDFIVVPGLRYYYDDLSFEGLDAEETLQARAFFVRTDGLLRTRQMLRFSRNELQAAIANLRTSLRNQGHDRATVVLASLDLHHDTGAVTARIRVNKGARYRLRQVQIRIRETPDGPVLEETLRSESSLLSRTSREDLEQRLVHDLFEQGYPDATVRLNETRAESVGASQIEVDLMAEVVRGPRIALGEIRFESPVALRNEASLRARADLDGPWLDRLAADEARARLARRGAYQFVRLRFEPSETDPDTRDVVFELEPGKLLTVDLLAGYRSYDLLYGGIDLLRRDVFGVGHIAELRAAQSFRSTEGYLTYSIPDAFAEDVTVFSVGEFLRREEVSFTRREFRAGAGVRKVFTGSGHQAGVRYSYEVLRADNAPLDPRVRSISPDDQPDVGAVSLDWSMDRRDSPLSPRSGYQLAATLETALPEFGGGSRYLRPEVNGSTHIGLKGGRYLNLGIRYTAIVDPSNDGLIPFNKRIFPGGEDSVRGYQRGEAGPRNADNEVIGAEAALVWMLELEQLLTSTWSVVGFVDGVAQATEIQEPLWNEVLWSVGAGLRWNSFIGPVRLEYGYNLNRRQGDPFGTLHFSVGFPF
jgi:outer membrane protein insertion porin family